MPKLSVVLPVYNSVTTVESAVRSILDQSFLDLEMIVVNDGSTDRTGEVLNAISDHRLKIIHAEHQGVAGASNLGLENAQSDWIARMDADDFAHPTKFCRQFDLLEKDDLDVCGCQIRIVDRDGKSSPTLNRYENWINVETLFPNDILGLRFVEFPLVNPTILACRRYFEIGFQKTELPEDYDLFLTAAKASFRFGKVPEVLFDWRDDSKRLTRTDDRYSRVAFDNCRKKHLLSGPLGGQKTVDLWGVGKTGKPWLRWLLANNLVVRNCYEVSPRRIGETIHGCQVRHPDTMPSSDQTPLVIAVGARNTRPKIIPFIRERGYVPGIDAWFVA